MPPALDEQPPQGIAGAPLGSSASRACLAGPACSGLLADLRAFLAGAVSAPPPAR